VFKYDGRVRVIQDKNGSSCQSCASTGRERRITRAVVVQLGGIWFTDLSMSSSTQAVFDCMRSGRGPGICKSQAGQSTTTLELRVMSAMRLERRRPVTYEGATGLS
jgi:hypothetical protein